MLKLLEVYKPKVILEIGTAKGGTLFLFSKIADPQATIISIDLPRSAFGRGYPTWRTALYKSFVKGKHYMHLIRANSHEKETKRKVEALLGKRRINFLFIDGDHTYKGVKKDFEMYCPLVGKRGLIAFHDIVPHAHDPSDSVGVPAFWEEIKSNYNYLEIVKDWRQGWAGIGVITA